MTLAAGQRLGPYEVLAPLGAGGMGEVYKASDTRLERIVALKVLAPHLSASPDVRQRFEREAKTISQLSHPHICALYDVGHQDGVDYLVMEYLEGETLADRLGRGALPLAQTLRFGTEIADALSKAHRQSIVHRDLKPGNVMLTRSGVKLLDFGLAKAFEPPAAKGSLTALPTQAALTQEGTILGTFQYMAPEQLEGKEADGRTDIFAFGAVLYEMATGKKAFAASSQASLITAIMSSDPPAISTIQPMAPPALDRVVKTCLAKDPEDRWQSAHDVAGELQWISEGSQAGAPAPVAGRRRNRERLAWSAAAVCFLGMLALGLLLMGRPGSAPSPVRFQVPLAGSTGATSGLALSPDGTQLAFVAPSPAATSALWLRPLDSVEARILPGTEGATMPFWSPDGRSLGFFASGNLKAINVASGPARTLCASSGDPRGGTWGPDGTILFPANFQSALLRVSENGGSPSPVTVLDASRKEQSHRWPSFLPDGRHFLYYASPGSGVEPGEILVGSLDGKPPKRVCASSSLAVFAPPGYLIFDGGTNIVAQRFDLERFELSGDPVPLGPQLSRIAEFSGYRPISTSATGVLAFQSGSATRTSRLTWLDRGGKELGVVDEGMYYAPRLSRDGSRLAVTRWDADTTVGDIWLFDLNRNVGSRLTFDPADESLSAWMPDGRTLIFGSSREGVVNLYRTRSDRTGNEEIVLRSDSFKVPDDVSPDGRFLLYETVKAKTGGNINLWVLPLSGDAKPRPFTTGSFSESAGQISPDGRWVAYVSAESGREEVYVAAFEGSGGKWQVSNAGGKTPRWRADGRELFYYGTDGNLMSAEVAAGPSFEAGVPRVLFKLRLVSSPDRQYEVSPDGKRFLANIPSTAAEAFPATVAIGWQAGLEKK